MRRANKRLQRKSPSKTLAVSGKVRVNRLRPAAERKKRRWQTSKAALFELDEPGAWMVPANLLAQCVGIVLLLPLCFITSRTFLECLNHTIGSSAWRTAPFWFFSLGLVMWLVNFFWLWRPIYLYVFGHEATHVLFTWMSLGKVHEFRVTSQGGHVLTDKNNLFISLSPYFTPFYTIIVAFVFWLIGSYVDLQAWHSLGWKLLPGFRWEWLGFWALGVTWGFHLTFTIWMIAKDQPDLKGNGTAFSLHLIYLANVLLLCLLVVVASSLTWRDFSQEWLRAAGDLRDVLADIGGWIHRLFEPL